MTTKLPGGSLFPFPINVRFDTPERAVANFRSGFEFYLELQDTSLIVVKITDFQVGAMVRLRWGKNNEFIELYSVDGGEKGYGQT